MENKKPSVMIVDDDAFLLDMYKKKFEQSGLVVESVAGTEDALGKLRDGNKPDILVLDIIMPMMDGLELLEKIRSENLIPETIVIMLTNESDQSKLEKARSLGVKGYIIKATAIPSEVVEETFKIAGIKQNKNG